MFNLALEGQTLKGKCLGLYKKYTYKSSPSAAVCGTCNLGRNHVVREVCS
jgi:hypothetical protein